MFPELILIIKQNWLRDTCTKSCSATNCQKINYYLRDVADLQLLVQSIPITTKVVSSNHVHGEVYSIQHNVMKFVSDLRQVGGFFPSTPVSPTNKADRHAITEILLKVGLNTISKTTN